MTKDTYVFNTIYTLMYNLDSLEIGMLYTKAAFSKCGALSVLPLRDLLGLRFFF